MSRVGQERCSWVPWTVLYQPERQLVKALPVLPSLSALTPLSPLSPSAFPMALPTCLDPPWTSSLPSQPRGVNSCALPQTFRPVTPPWPFEQSTPPWLIPPSTPPGTIIPSAPSFALFSISSVHCSCFRLVTLVTRCLFSMTLSCPYSPKLAHKFKSFKLNITLIAMNFF